MINQRGVIGLPFRLTVVFIIVLMCVPTLTVTADHFYEDAEIQGKSPTWIPSYETSITCISLVQKFPHHIRAVE